EVGLAVLGDRLRQDVAPVPDLGLTHVVDVLHPARATSLSLRVGHVEHVVREGGAFVVTTEESQETVRHHATALSVSRGGRSCKMAVAVTGCSRGSLCCRKSWMCSAARRRPSMREMRAASCRQRSR